MNISTILVVDDDRQIRRVLRTTLLSSGYDVVEATNGDDAIRMIIRERPDLVLLDVNMSELSGLEACSKIRSSFQGPIIMVTVRESERDKILALDSGADDYVVKPFGVGELLARIRANLRRRTREDLLLKIETLELYWDFDSRLIEVRGNRVHLTPKEFDVLRFLVIHLGKPVTHKSVLQNVWGPDHIEETEYLRVVINQLRKKIERDPARPKYIITEQWVGYSFQLPGEVREKAFRRKP
ncbi:MAG TPA: response regulator transcription factor [Candidatus Acidoferrales bacterium]|nr:response regulator transcription factor [Candidatus Acidoferrales bacterium]